MPEIIRPSRLKWFKSTGGYAGTVSTEEIVSGFLYNVFPPIVSEDLLIDGGYFTRLVYLKNEYTTSVAHVRLWFVYPQDPDFGDKRPANERVREVLLVGVQWDRRTPPTNAPANENSLPSGVYLHKIPLDNSDYNSYAKGIEVGRLRANEAIPIWLILKIPPLVQPTIFTSVRIVAEGVLLSA
jgi:hypothetical protein